MILNWIWKPHVSNQLDYRFEIRGTDSRIETRLAGVGSAAAAGGPSNFQTGWRSRVPCRPLRRLLRPADPNSVKIGYISLKVNDFPVANSVKPVLIVHTVNGKRNHKQIIEIWEARGIVHCLAVQ